MRKPLLWHSQSRPKARHACVCGVPIYILEHLFGNFFIHFPAFSSRFLIPQTLQPQGFQAIASRGTYLGLHNNFTTELSEQLFIDWSVSQAKPSKPTAARDRANEKKLNKTLDKQHQV